MLHSSGIASQGSGRERVGPDVLPGGAGWPDPGGFKPDSDHQVRCQRKCLLFHYEPDVQYSVGPQAGECGIEVVGNPGTTFDLTQS